MRAQSSVFLYVFISYMGKRVICTGECISSSNPKVSPLVDNLNDTSCMTLSKKPEVVPPEGIPLQVNNACVSVNGFHVEIMALFKGQQDCSHARFLFAPHEGPDCSWGHRCHTRKENYRDNGTLCLVQCKKEKRDGLHYELELIHGIQRYNMELCGLKLYHDPCAEMPCGNNGECVDSIDSYSCRCQPDFTGTNCEIKIDNCKGVIYENNGTCEDGTNSFSCDCQDGFTGDTCEINNNDSEVNICQNGGTCQDGINSFTCECTGGFTGEHCETDVDDCHRVICQNNGTCQDGVNSFSCECTDGFTGNMCETNIDDCDGVICQNNGTCQDEINSFSCDCTDGFTGNMCETNIDDCDGVICQNNGTCQDGVNSFSCDCTDGFTGNMCETNIDDCDETSCQNDGTCQDGINSFSCGCTNGFNGDRCETNIDDCEEVICQNGGTCQDGINSFFCECADGFTGDNCETDVDECDGVICHNGGTCQDSINNYICNCTCGFSGRNCEKPVNNVTWIPPSGWTGPCSSFYMSFDNVGFLVLMEASEMLYFDAMVPGKVNSAVSTNSSLSQWIDLGFHTEACMTRPETCGAAGGAISVWMKVGSQCDGKCGILSSVRYRRTGSIVYQQDEKLGTRVNVPSGAFIAQYPRPEGWTHIVLNYLGPNIGEGIMMFFNGTQVASDATKLWDFSGGDGRIIVGRINTDKDNKYSSAEIDELIYFNNSLTTEEIALLSEIV